MNKSTSTQSDTTMETVLVELIQLKNRVDSLEKENKELKERANGLDEKTKDLGQSLISISFSIHDAIYGTGEEEDEDY